jgi:hypothetical protein
MRKPRGSAWGLELGRLSRDRFLDQVLLLYGVRWVWPVREWQDPWMFGGYEATIDAASPWR